MANCPYCGSSARIADRDMYYQTIYECDSCHERFDETEIEEIDNNE